MSEPSTWCECRTAHLCTSGGVTSRLARVEGALVEPLLAPVPAVSDTVADASTDGGGHADAPDDMLGPHQLADEHPGIDAPICMARTGACDRIEWFHIGLLLHIGVEGVQLATLPSDDRHVCGGARCFTGGWNRD